MRHLIDEALASYYRATYKVVLTGSRRSYPGYVRASNLGSCPLAAAREKLGVAPDLPMLVKGATAQSIVTLQSGEYAARMYQEALVYEAGRRGSEDGYDVKIEVDCTDHRRRVSGRADAVIDNAILEFKYTFADRSTDPGEPRLGHAWQLMSYARARYELGISQEMYLVTIGKYDYKVWELKPIDDGFSFHDTTTDEWLGPGLGGWNEPSNITYDHLDEVIDEAHFYLSRGGVATPPIQDPLTDPRGYYCLKTTKDYKRNTGTAVPNCPWTLTCHGINSDTPISRNGSGSEWELNVLKGL